MNTNLSPDDYPQDLDRLTRMVIAVIVNSEMDKKVAFEMTMECAGVKS